MCLFIYSFFTFTLTAEQPPSADDGQWDTTEWRRVFETTFRVLSAFLKVPVNDLYRDNKDSSSVLYCIIIIMTSLTSTDEVVFSLVSICWFVSRFTHKLLNRSSRNSDGGWVSAQIRPTLTFVEDPEEEQIQQLFSLTLQVRTLSFYILVIRQGILRVSLMGK